MVRENYDAVSTVDEYYPIFKNERGETVTAVKAAWMTAPQTTQRYNLAGQKVNDSFRGIVIENGSKRIVR